ncbi:MAG: CAP domain-containing protein [Acidimicrobiia bacterium]|jgi:hypothetical protein
MPGKKHWLSLLLVVFASTALGVAATADSGTESEFVSLINSTRASNGLGSLQVDGGLQSHARNHTQDMIAAGDIYHSSSSELSAAAGSGWSQVGENVGRGQSPSSLHQAFMNSSGHAANILGDYNYVGVGTDTDSDGTLYVTVVFMKMGETAPPTTEAPPPPPDSPDTTAPPSDEGGEPAAPAPTTTTPSTTTTSAPNTTTTTMIVPPDRPVIPGQSCIEASRFAQLCHD